MPDHSEPLIVKRGTVITYHADAVNGDSFVINYSGVYAVSYSDGDIISDDIGISLNLPSTTKFSTSWGTSQELCAFEASNAEGASGKSGEFAAAWRTGAWLTSRERWFTGVQPLRPRLPAGGTLSPNSAGDRNRSKEDWRTELNQVKECRPELHSGTPLSSIETTRQQKEI